MHQSIRKLEINPPPPRRVFVLFVRLDKSLGIRLLLNIRKLAVEKGLRPLILVNCLLTNSLGLQIVHAH